MATTQQKFIVDTQKRKGKESKYHSKESHQITKKKAREGERNRETTKQPENKEQNGSRYKSINIYFQKKKWTKFSNQKTQSIKYHV